MKYSLGVLAVFAICFLFQIKDVWGGFSQAVISDVSYQIQGKERILKFKVLNLETDKWQDPVKVEVLGSRNKVKHSFVFVDEIMVSASKMGDVELRWLDEGQIVGREKVRLYVKEGKDWQMVGEAYSDWQMGSGVYIVPFGVLIGMLVMPGLLIRKSPNGLLNLIRKEVRVYAQRPA